MIRKDFIYFDFKYSFAASVLIHFLGLIIAVFVIVSPHKKIYVSIPIEMIHLEPAQEEKEEVIVKEDVVVKEQPKIKEIVKKNEDAISVKNEEKPKENIAPQKRYIENKLPEIKKTETSVRQRVRNLNKVNNKTVFTPTVAGDFPYTYYLRLIQSKISSNWDIGSTQTEDKKVIIFFKILRDGSIEDTRFSERSGDEQFDYTAMRAVQLGAPFPPLPQEYSESYLGVYFGFDFKN
ncbi:MAG: TonB family protein [Elusimicrobiota bacterium]